MFWLFSVLLQPTEDTSLSGYKVFVRTIVYEDGSIARKVELGLDPDTKESIKYKKKFLVENGYDVYEKETDSSFYLIGSKITEASRKSENIFSDGISSINIHRVEDEFQYHEEFFTSFVMEEVKKSDLRNDEAAAKVLLANTQFDFVTQLPGRMIGVNSGEFDKNEAHWKYDVEQLFKNASFVMEAKSSIQRDETLIWVIFLVGLLILSMGVLMLMKKKNSDDNEFKKHNVQP